MIDEYQAKINSDISNLVSWYFDELKVQKTLKLLRNKELFDILPLPNRPTQKELNTNFHTI